MQSMASRKYSKNRTLSVPKKSFIGIDHNTSNKKMNWISIQYGKTKMNI
jgi:hypothetical protein